MPIPKLNDADLDSALSALKSGGMVILVDHEDRENEGDLVLAAEFATAEAINFMIREARGLVCLSLTEDHADRLGLVPMVAHNRTPRKTAFTVSIEAAQGVSTGISPADRAHTILTAIDQKTTSSDIVSPGHVFPLRAVKGGVLARDGHTEGSLELCRLAELKEAAVICEIVNDDGSMARGETLIAFAKKHRIPMLSMNRLIRAAVLTRHYLEYSPKTRLPQRRGNHEETGGVTLVAVRNTVTQQEHAVITTEEDARVAPVPVVPWVRIHSECLTGDALNSARCDCGDQLHYALAHLQISPGIVIYLKGQEGRGIGLFEKIKAYELQDQGKDTIDANQALGHREDLRSYADAARILMDQGITTIRLMSNSPQKKQELERFGIIVSQVIPIPVQSRPSNARYLKTKKERLGHFIGDPL